MKNLIKRLDNWLQSIEPHKNRILIVLFLISIVAAGLETTDVLRPLNIDLSPVLVIGLQLFLLVLMLAFLASSPEYVGFLLLILGLYIGIRGFDFLYPKGFSSYQATNDFYANLSSELVSIAVTVLIIDRLSERREIKLMKSRLIREMKSNDNSTALKAVGELRGLGWLNDGSLKNNEMWSANLEAAILHKSDLSFVDFGRANLRSSDLREAKLTNTVLTEVDFTNARLRPSQLVEANALRDAIMPDGKKYDGRFNLLGDINRARIKGLDPSDPISMATFYHIPLENFLFGQEKSHERFNDEWEGVSMQNQAHEKRVELSSNWLPLTSLLFTFVGAVLGYLFARSTPKI
ncbi:MAG: pentapeptide repeat-containing protein [Ardenticatenaceae bacterium]|nr:pentapeptide repeat-containing protein [Ardenticatenaceae bacterium]